MKIQSPPGSTPLDEEALRGLIPNLTTQGELNEFEEENISQAILWARSSRTLKKDLISVTGLIKIHQKMFAQTWTWAGVFRTREANIGVSPASIQNELGALLGNVKYWIQQETYSIEEIAIRLKHRLVFIHPFVNGNGRHSRLVADLLMQSQGRNAFTWGKANLVTESPHRNTYLKALRVADQSENYKSLLRFAKS